MRMNMPQRNSRSNYPRLAPNGMPLPMPYPNMYPEPYPESHGRGIAYSPRNSEVFDPLSPPIYPIQPRQPRYAGQFVTKPKRITKSDFLSFAHTCMPIESIKVIDDIPATFKHICPKIMPRYNPIRILNVSHFSVPEFSGIPYYYCPVCKEFLYSWIA